MKRRFMLCLAAMAVLTGLPSLALAEDGEAAMLRAKTNMCAWTPLETEDSNWNEPFYLVNYLDPGYEKGVAFGTHKTPGLWDGANGMFVDATITQSNLVQRMQNSGIAWQMRGEELGSVSYTQNDGPSGLDALTFRVRLAQTISFDDFSVWCGDGSLTTNNYAVVVPALLSCNSTSSSFDYAPGASMSVVGYYQPKVGCYEVRIERNSSDGLQISIYKWHLKEYKIASERLATRWFKGANFVNNSGETRPNMYGILLSLGEDDAGRTTIVAGLTTTSYAPSATYMGVNYNLVCCQDGDSPHTKGSYGVLAANCNGRFLHPRQHDSRLPKSWLSETGVLASYYANKNVALFGEYDAITCRRRLLDAWAYTPGRIEYYENVNYGIIPSAIGLRAPANLAQNVDVYLKSRSSNSASWSLFDSIPVSSYGFSTKTVTIRTNENCHVMLKTGANPVDVTVWDITQTGWNGADIAGIGHLANDFVYTQVRVLDDAVDNERYTMLQPARALAEKALSIRSPLLSDLGKVEFSYKDVRPGCEVWVQVATNSVAWNLTGMLGYNFSTSSVEPGERENIGQWITLRKYTYEELVAGSKQICDCGWRTSDGNQIEGVFRILIPPHVVSAAQAVAKTDPEWGSVTITDMSVYDSPNTSGNTDDGSTVITAPEPTVKIFLDSSSATKTVTATADYITCNTQLAVKMDPVCNEDVTVDLNALVSGDDTLSSLSALYDADIIRIAENGYGGDPTGQKLTSVTIPANTSVVYLNVYVLGGTSLTGTKGITFSTAKTAGPDNVVASGSCTLKINRSTPVIADSDPAFSTEGSPSTITVVSGAFTQFSLTIEDAYRELYDIETGYTFRWTCDGEVIGDDTCIVMDDDGLFVGGARFYNITSGSELTLCVVNPSGVTSAKVKYNLVVTEAKSTTIAFADATKLVYAEGETANVDLGLTQAYKGTGYIFLGADNAADLACVTSTLTSSGAQIAQGTTKVATSRQIRFLDGDRDVNLKAILCSANSPASPVTTYVSGTLSFTITNVPPQVTSLVAAGQYITPDMNGQTVYAVPQGVAQSFSVVVSDVDADRLAAGSDAMAVQWVIDGTTYETFGDPSTNVVVKHTFANVKDKAQVRVYVKDKDMSAYPAAPNFMFYVPVYEQPSIAITTSVNGGIFNETDGIDSTVTVSLSEWASSKIRVRFTVSQASDGGCLKLSTVAGSVEQALDGEGNEIPGAYDIVFAVGDISKDLVVSNMDGTSDTILGLELNAMVTTEATNGSGVRWCDFYAAAEPVRIRVRNVKPEINVCTNMDAYVNVPYPITYSCNDVAADLSSGIRVEIAIDGSPVRTETITDSEDRIYSAEFLTEGSHVVQFTFTDKDWATSRQTLWVFAKPAKMLQLRAHGPGSAIGTPGGYSQHYATATGLGAGRVYAGDNGPQRVQGFVHTYSFGIKETAITAYGVGYKADGSYDDGSLTPYPDKGIDSNGDWSKSSVIADDGYYNYTLQNMYGMLGYDSFVYAWACNNTEASTSSGSEGETTTASLLFTIGESARANIPLPANEKDATSFPKQYWEAIFSREMLRSDNCGDINQDGIPDVVVARYGMGIFDPVTGKLAVSQGSGVSSEGDLADLKDYNNDLDNNGAGSPDFLPCELMSDVGGVAFPYLGETGNAGADFTAELEIRGYDRGLNDAMEQLGFDTVKPDRVYAVATTNNDGSVTWGWSRNCTISYLEWFAWKEYADANGLDWADSANWRKWSPERPTNPTKSDTDGDGFSDGIEYWVWYRARVGYFDNGVHKRLTGRRYIGNGDYVAITSKEIEYLMDPRVASGNPSDALLRDTDNDGLPDLVELAIGTNPFDFDTDGDGLLDEPLVSPGLFDIGDTFTRQIEEKAAAFAQEINSDIETYLSVPAGVLNRSAYRSLFRAMADGRIVKFDLTDEAAAAVKRQVDAATLEIPLAAVSAGSDDSVIIQNPTAGLWYSISSGPAMDALVEGARKMATGKTLTLEVPCLGSSGFYKVNANITGKE